MKLRHVFVAPDIDTAKRCAREARELGIEDSDIALITATTLELQGVPEDLKDDSATDFVPAALRGAIGGGLIGLVAGLIGLFIPALGISGIGVGFVALVGAAIGMWSAALMGAAIPNEVHRRFEDRIRPGEVLVMLDIAEERMALVEARIAPLGVRKIDYEAHAALT